MVAVVLFLYNNKPIDNTVQTVASTNGLMKNETVHTENPSNQYSKILADYKAIIASAFSETFEDDINTGKFQPLNEDLRYEWNAMLGDMNDGLENPTKASFGYVLYDFDQNGSEELFWVREDHTILAVFAMEEEPLLLDAFWSKHKCYITGSGDLLIFNSSSAQDFVYSLKSYNDADGMLKTIKEFGCDGGQYYVMKNNEKFLIDEKQFMDLKQPYINEEGWESLEIIAI